MFIKHISVFQARQITFSGYIEQGCNFSYIFKFNQTLQSTSIQLFFPSKINVACRIILLETTNFTRNSRCFCIFCLINVC